MYYWMDIAGDTATRCLLDEPFKHMGNINYQRAIEEDNANTIMIGDCTMELLQDKYDSKYDCNEQLR